MSITALDIGESVGILTANTQVSWLGRQMMRVRPLHFVLLYASLSAFAAETETRRGTFTVEVDLSAATPGEEARLWLPYPVSDSDQRVWNIKVAGDYVESAVYTDRMGSPMLFARWEKGAKSRKLTFTFSVERQAVSCGKLPLRDAAWDPAGYVQFLGATSLGPIDGKIKKLADEITAGKATVLEKAKAIYDWVCVNMRRDPQTRGCGTGDICTLLDKPQGKCADIHSMFVALLRAAGVPARDVFGIRQGAEATQDLTGGQHCWAEFYLPAFGWVPADPADVLKLMLTEKLQPTDEKALAVRERLFGGLDAARVKFSTGRDISLNPPQQGKPLNYVMYPYAEIGGQVPDWIDAATFKYSIKYEKLMR